MEKVEEKKSHNLSVLKVGRSVGLTAVLLSFLISAVSASQTSFTKDGLQVIQQSKMNLKGTVVDNKGETLIGVNVVQMGTSNGTITDVNGEFTISVSSGAVLQFSYIGYITKEIPVNNEERLKVVLSEDAQKLDEVVVVGYGTARKKDLTGSIVRVDAKSIDTQPAGNFVELLRGRVAGFNSTMSTGAKETLGDLVIRGQTSIKANNTPLVVLDGMIYYGDIADINPRDIASIDVLKDASSAAIYGARAAAGVILVTTKKGEVGKPTVNLSTSVGFSQIAAPTRERSPKGYLDERMWYYKMNSGNKPAGFYDNPNQLPAGVSLDDWRGMSSQDPSMDDTNIWLGRIGLQDTEIENYNKGKVTNWFDEVFQTGLRQDYNISVSGRSDRISYYTSLGFLQNEGIIFGDKYQNVRLRANMENKVTNWFKFGINTQFANRNEKWEGVSTWDRFFFQSPYGNLYNEDGSYTWNTYGDSEGVNPFLNQNIDKLRMRRTLSANVYGIITLPWGFSFQTTFSNRFAFHQDYSFTPSTTGRTGNAKGSGSRQDYTLYEYNIDNMLKWNKTYGDHRFDVTLLYSAEKYQTWKSVGSNKDFAPSENLSYHGIGYGANPVVSSDDQYRTGDAMMGRLNYSLKDRYFFSASIRRDGYSEFGQDNPYAWFTSFGFGWMLSDEKFIHMPEWLDMTKLRASYGTNGNRDIPLYAALSDLSSNKYLYGNEAVIGVATNKMANRLLQWEKTTAYNFAVDFSLLGNRLSGTIEGYTMSTHNLLLQRSLPRVTGFQNVWSNMGELRNNGLEVTLNADLIQHKNFSWSSGLLTYFNRNKIISLYGDMVDVLDEKGNVVGQKEADDEASGWFIGHSLDEIYNYKVLGVYQLGEEEEAAKYGKRPGDFKLQDVNKDGKIDSAHDKMFLGHRNPTWRLNWTNTFTFFNDLQLSFMLTGQFGHKADSQWHKHDQFTYGRTNHLDYPYWTPENPINDYARLGSSAGNPNFDYLVNRAFLRMEMINLSYNLPQRWLKCLQIEAAKVYCNVNNAFVITGWDYYDPETKAPTPRTCTFGLNVTF